MKVAQIVFYIILLASCAPLSAAEADPRLAEIAHEKKDLDDQADRGRLLIENAQLKMRELHERYKAIAAEAAVKSKEQSAKGKEAKAE